MNEKDEEHLGHGELVPGQKRCKMFGAFVYCKKDACTGCSFWRDEV